MKAEFMHIGIPGNATEKTVWFMRTNTRCG